MTNIQPRQRGHKNISHKCWWMNIISKLSSDFRKSRKQTKFKGL